MSKLVFHTANRFRIPTALGKARKRSRNSKQSSLCYNCGMKEAISPPDAPKAIGPYSPAIRAAGMVFVSGQIAIDPASGNFAGGSIAAQTEQVMKNLRALLSAAGSGLEQVLKTTVYLKTMDDFAAMNEVYGRYFTATPPARATVAVAGLPKDALVEIEVIAVLRK